LQATAFLAEDQATLAREKALAEIDLTVMRRFHDSQPETHRSDDLYQAFDDRE